MTSPVSNRRMPFSSRTRQRIRPRTLNGIDSADSSKSVGHCLLFSFSFLDYSWASKALIISYLTGYLLIYLLTRLLWVRVRMASAWKAYTHGVLLHWIQMVVLGLHRLLGLIIPDLNQSLPVSPFLFSSLLSFGSRIIRPEQPSIPVVLLRNLPERLRIPPRHAQHDIVRLLPAAVIDH